MIRTCSEKSNRAHIVSLVALASHNPSPALSTYANSTTSGNTGNRRVGTNRRRSGDGAEKGWRQSGTLLHVHWRPARGRGSRGRHSGDRVSQEAWLFAEAAVHADP